jgi:twitching motility protein PilT
MVVTGTIRDCIVDPERTSEIPDHIAEGRVTYGMQTFDQGLMDLVASDQVDYAIAKAAATNPSDFELKLNMLSGGRAPAGAAASGSAPPAGVSQSYF